MVNSLILVDSSLNITELISKISNFIETKIISFDIESHNTLTKLGIEHDKIENYIDNDDQNLIDELSIGKAIGWYNQDGISDLLQYENLNLGCLIEGEFSRYLLQIMKNFVGVIRLIDKENPLTISTSDSLISMIKIIDKDNKITIDSIPKKIITQSNQIMIPIVIGKKLINIKIPLILGLKIIRIIGSIMNIIFNFKINVDQISNKKSILLVDFSPTQYSDFLMALSKLGSNILLLNERGSPVWNINNLKIVTHSRSKIMQLHDFLDSKLKSTIEKKQHKLYHDLENLNSSTKLDEFFSICGYSFWGVIKEHFNKMCLQRFNEGIKRLELSKKLFTKTHISCIVVLYNTALEEMVMLHIAKVLKIPCIVLQHGHYTDGTFQKRFLPLMFPQFQTDLKYAIWGKKMINPMIQSGIKENNLILSGSPKYDQLFEIKNICKNDGVILVASTFLQNQHQLSGYDTNLSILHENIFHEICRISNNISNKRLIVKLHPSKIPQYDVQSTLSGINKSIPIYRTQNITDLMKNCDVVVCIDHSTILLEAMILEKPTITFMIDSKRYENDEMVKNQATITVKSIKEFEEVLDKILFNDSFKNDVIEKGKKFVNEYLMNPGNSSEFLANELKKY